MTTLLPFGAGFDGTLNVPSALFTSIAKNAHTRRYNLQSNERNWVEYNTTKKHAYSFDKDKNTKYKGRLKKLGFIPAPELSTKPKKVT
jgi:hypothetical protein